MSLPLPSPPSKVQGLSELCPGLEPEQSAPALPRRLLWLPCDPPQLVGSAHMCPSETLAPSDAATQHSSSVAKLEDPTEAPQGVGPVVPVEQELTRLY